MEKNRLPLSTGVKHGKRLTPVLKYLIDESISLSELARRCGLTRQAMSLRIAKDDCRLSDLEQMAEAAGYTLEWSWKKKEE